MKKNLSKIPLIFLFVFSMSACANGAGEGDSTSQGSGLIIGELPESVIAELGDRFTIPYLEVTNDDLEVEVDVNVKNPNGQEVELISRNTKFFVDLLGTYVVNYHFEVEQQSYDKYLDVVVEDNKGPEIKLPSTAYSINVKLNDVVTIPTATWTDVSGTVKDETITVSHNNNPVTVTNNTFVANDFGVYNVTYSAKDGFDNETKETINIECAKSIIIEPFENASTAWADPSVSEFTTEHAIEGNCLRVNSKNSWTLLAVYPKYYDLSGFTKFRLSVYADSDMNSSDEGLYLLNHKYTLEQGENTVVITKDDMNSMYPGCQIPSALPSYYDIPYIWFQVRSTKDANVYVDNFEGIFNVTATDTQAPTIDFGNNAHHGVLNVNEGEKLVVPTGVAYDDSLENISVDYRVNKKTGEDITSEVKAGNFVIGHNEEYVATYSAQDSSGNKSSKQIQIKTINKSDLPDMLSSEYFPTTQYDVLQDFEDTGLDWTQIENSYVAEHVMSGSKSLKLSTQGSDTCVVLNLKRNGEVLTNEMWKEYSKIRAYVYADNSNARFDFYGDTHYLNAGPNIVEITGNGIVNEIAKANNVYDYLGGFYFQLTTGTVYVDSIIGIY